MRAVPGWTGSRSRRSGETGQNLPALHRHLRLSARYARFAGDLPAIDCKGSGCAGRQDLAIKNEPGQPNSQARKPKPHEKTCIYSDTGAGNSFNLGAVKPILEKSFGVDGNSTPLMLKNHKLVGSWFCNSLLCSTGLFHGDANRASG